MSSHTAAPHRYDFWTWNDRLRLTNAKLSRRQHSSCRLTFCSLWILIFSVIGSLLVYRFTDQCRENDSGKIFFLHCLRYWLLFVTLGIASCACCSLFLGLYKYLRARPRPFPYPSPTQPVQRKASQTNVMPPYNYEEIPMVIGPTEKSICYTTCVRGVDIWQTPSNIASSFY